MQHNQAFADAVESSGALAELFCRQRQPLGRFLLGLLRDRSQADDVLQQVFLKLTENWSTIRPETAKAWLFTVAYHEALAHRRRQKRQAAAMVELWARPVWSCQHVPPDAACEAVRREAVEVVRHAIDQLPESQREVVRRRIYDNQTFATIAADLVLPLGTVLTRMRLALKSLTDLLEE